MRILMLAQFYAPIIGGEERHAQVLSSELVKRGHDVAVVTLWHQGMAEFEVDQGVRIYRIHSTTERVGQIFSEAGRRHSPPFPDPEALLGLRAVVERERPEIVHAHNWLVHSFLPLKSWSEAKLVVSLHDYNLICAKKSMLYQDAPCSGRGVWKCLTCASNHYGITKGIPTLAGNWVMSAVERAAVDMFLPVSQATAIGNRLVNSQLPFQVIPNFVPDTIALATEDSEPYLAQLPKEDYLLYVGDLRRFKGIDVLLRAYAELPNAPTLVLIGRECADAPSEFPPNVLVLKSWPHHAVMQAWQRSILALLPSVGPETFGIVVIEAMASGRPVIASRIGGLPDVVVDGETGLLVTPGDAVELRQAITRLLGDVELRERMGQAGRLKAHEFLASTVVPRIEQVYQALITPERTAGLVRRRVEEGDYCRAGEP